MNSLVSSFRSEPRRAPATRKDAPACVADNAHQLIWQLWLPLLVSSALVIWLELYSGNQRIADFLYGLGGNQWLWRRHPITSQWIHPGGKYLSLMVWLLVAVAWWRSRGTSSKAFRHAALGRLLLATVIATLVVTLIKSGFAMDCPWDLQRYGGEHAWFGLFDPRPGGFKASGCFPAGHASAGYCWVAAWFTAQDLRPRLRWWLLAGGLVLGLVFGISQQLRGAHFVSHDLVTLLICWLSALAVHHVAQLAKRRATTS